MRVAIFLLFAVMAYGQAAVEAGLGASRAVTTAAPAAGAGKSIAGAFGSLDKTLKGDKAASDVITVRSSAAVSHKGPAKTYEDIRTAEVGLDYEVLIERFGPAAIEVTVGRVRKLTYPGKDGSTKIEITEGKVSAVAGPKLP